MSTARYLVGDVFDRMAQLDDGSVDLILTSPPFLALRSYLPADHPDKALEIGSEPTPAVFLDTLLALTAEWRRLLAPHGSICVELGDTYSSVGTSKPMTFGNPKHTYDQTKGRTSVRGSDGWPLDKSLCGIPHLYHLSLAYGRNLLTGEPSPAGQWRVRNVVAWCRPNPPVGALGDKFRPGTSYMTVACVSGSRYFDLDAVRTAQTEPDRVFRKDKDPGRGDGWGRISEGMQQNPAGAPPLDWWEIPTHAYPGAHYATWPPELCRKPIESMCPRRVCTECGQPSRRIVEASEDYAAFRAQQNADYAAGDRSKVGARDAAGSPGAWDNVSHGLRNASYQTVGWSDCGHGPLSPMFTSPGQESNWRNGLVLDPFAGSGTTLAVATGHGRDAIGIDLDPRNAQLARERIGMFVTIEDPEAVA